MEPSFFTSSVISGFLSIMESLGYLNVAAGVFMIVGYGFWYHNFLHEKRHQSALNFDIISVVGARLLLGSILFVMGGLNGFFQFVPAPVDESCAACQQFLGGLAASGYLFPAVKTVELLTGALLLVGLWTPLALVVAAPIVLNIGLYHLFLDFSGIGVAAVIVACEVYLAYRYRSVFLPLFERKPELSPMSFQDIQQSSAYSSHPARG
jgi:uncharacterized membrane protein YphA (DoxX/SURF4 family)